MKEHISVVSNLVKMSVYLRLQFAIFKLLVKDPYIVKYGSSTIYFQLIVWAFHKYIIHVFYLLHYFLHNYFSTSLLTKCDTRFICVDLNHAVFELLLHFPCMRWFQAVFFSESVSFTLTHVHV